MNGRTFCSPSATPPPTRRYPICAARRSTRWRSGIPPFPLWRHEWMVRIALVQQRATADKANNVKRGLRALETAAAQGAKLVTFAELAFEPFYPQRPATADVRRLAEPVP